jgi:hypothetical protein
MIVQSGCQVNNFKVSSHDLPALPMFLLVILKIYLLLTVSTLYDPQIKQPGYVAL